MDTRPKIKIELSSTDKIIEKAGWVILIYLWGFTLFVYSSLPGIIPIHFNASGQVDNSGARATIFLLPILGTIVFSGMTFLNRYPHIFNYPVKITEDNALDQYTNATRMIRFLKLIIIIIFTALTWSIYLAAKERKTDLGSWFLPAVIAVMFLPIIYFIMKSFKAK